MPGQERKLIDPLNPITDEFLQDTQAFRAARSEIAPGRTLSIVYNSVDSGTQKAIP